ncbi:MAG TPA: Stp1/IreP family PP2C-type Ser/Thr phosphatase [Byssovorax sp.]
MPAGSPRLRAASAGATDVGRQRKHNEDHVLVIEPLDLWVVADGMGGHNAGDIASRLTTTSLRNFFEATRTDPVPAELLVGEDPPPDAQEGKRLVAGIRKANRDVFVISSTHTQHQGMGSTIVAAHFDGGAVHVAHVGDSRCYRVRDGSIKQITRDHSLINDALEMKPDLTDEELARLPKNIITRALGMKDDVKVDCAAHDVEVGDLYLLCSDGLSGMISDERMLEVVSLTTELQEACDLLIAEANDAGGSDNISAVLVRIEEAPADSPKRSAPPAPASQPPPVVAVSSSKSDLPPELLTTLDRGMESVLTPSMRAALEDGAELDLELAGPWGGAEEAPRKRCVKCNHELFAGNMFCVECGARSDP